MDIRDTPEQAELRRIAHRLVRELGPGNVADLDDHKRSQRLAEAVREPAPAPKGRRRPG